MISLLTVKAATREAEDFRGSEGISHGFSLTQRLSVETHLCFEQAQPKMYHSPKVDDGVDVFFLNFLKTNLQTFFFGRI